MPRLREAHTHKPRLLPILLSSSVLELTKTEGERQELIESMRRTEIKWAKRCLIALSFLAIAVLIIVLAAVYLTR